MARYVFEHREAFLEQLRALVAAGVDPDTIGVRMPYYVPEALQIVGRKPDRLRFFPLAGGLAGFGGGLALTIYSVLSWPIIVGGKPIVSLPPFLLIGYLLTILFGALATFAGFLLLARLPSVSGLAADGEFPAHFVIVVEQEGAP